MVRNGKILEKYLKICVMLFKNWKHIVKLMGNDMSTIFLQQILSDKLLLVVISCYY